MLDSNRAILLTPPQPAAIAVVRLTGPRVGEFLAAHFSAKARPGRCVHGLIRRGNDVIDDAVVVLAKDGALADVNLHGGPWVVRSMLELVRSAGFAVIDPPPLPLDYVAVAETPTLRQREILQHLPLARTELAARCLLAQDDAWAAAGESIDPAELLADRSLWWLLNPPSVAVVGLPNVGKSSLANQLFAQERSIAADLPGTTRDWVGELANIDGLTVMLIDTPGQRPADDAIERAAIDASAGRIRQAELVIIVLDTTIPLDSQQHLLGRHRDAIVVANKFDRPTAWPALPANVVPTVATTGEGVDNLRRAILRHFGCAGLDPSRPRWWTIRQRDLLRQAASGDRGALLRLWHTV